MFIDGNPSLPLTQPSGADKDSLFVLPPPPSYLSSVEPAHRDRILPPQRQSAASGHPPSTPLGSSSTADLPPWSSRLSNDTQLATTSRLRSPRTPRGLRDALLRLLHRDPPPSLSELIRYHTSYGPLQSVESHNLLIGVALWHNQWGIARKLLNRMEFANIQPNLETRKLRTRLLIRTGGWVRAWRQECSTSQTEGSLLPFTIWAEFFGCTKYHGVRRLETTTSPSGKPLIRMVPVPPSERDDPISRLNQMRVLLQYLPNVNLRQVVDVPARIIRSVVGTTLIGGHADYAKQLTECYFRSLPAVLGEGQLSHCTEIIHLHLLNTPKRGLAKYYNAIRALRHYLAFHSQFRPTPKTLLCILRTLRDTKKAATISQHMVAYFEKRWGPEIVDPQVKYRLASFAFKEGRIDIARALVIHQLKPKINRRLELPNSRPTKLKKLPRIRTIYLGRNKEVQKWKMLRNRILQCARPDVSLSRQTLGWQYQAQIAKVLAERAVSCHIQKYLGSA